MLQVQSSASGYDEVPDRIDGQKVQDCAMLLPILLRREGEDERLRGATGTNGPVSAHEVVFTGTRVPEVPVHSRYMHTYNMNELVHAYRT